MKKKRGLCMAAGGLIGDVDESARRRAEIAAKYGVTTGESRPTQQPPAPTPTPAPAPAPQRRGGLMGAFDALTNRKRQIEAAAGYAQGGIVRGPGGPEDDEVPMQIAGKDVRLSNTEAVLPARTVRALGGPEAVEALIEQTNGKPPVKGGLRQGGKYYGGLVDDFGDRVKAQGQMPPVTVNDSVTGQTVKPKVRPTIAGQQDFRANAPQPAPQVNATAPKLETPTNKSYAKGSESPEAAKMAEDRAKQAAEFDKARAEGGHKPSSPKPTLSGAMGSARQALNGTVGKLGAAGAGANAVLGAMEDDSTKKYATRFGVDEPTGDGSVGDILKFTALRAGGAATDIGSALTMGLADELYRDKQKVDTGLLGGSVGALTGSMAPGMLGKGLDALARGVTRGRYKGNVGERWLGGTVGKTAGAVAGGTAGAALGADETSRVSTENLPGVPKPAAPSAQSPVGATVVKGSAKPETVMQPNEGPRPDGPQAIDPVTKLPVGLAAAAKANDGRANFVADMDATKYKPAEGTGVITRAPDKDGLRSSTFIGGPSAADAARDAKFEAAGYGKDAYGNWMTPQRQALQQAGKEWEERNYRKQAVGSLGPSALSNGQQELLKKALTPYEGAPNGQLTANQINAARGILGDAARFELDAAQLGLKQQEMEHGARLARDKGAREGVPGFRDLLEAQKFRYQMAKDSQQSADRARDYLTSRADKHDEKVGKILDTYSTVDGKVDPQKRSIVEKFMANFDKTYEGPPEQYFAELEDRLAIERVLEAQGRSGFTNWGERQKPWSGDKTTGLKEGDAPWYRVGDSKLWEDEYGRRYGSEIEKRMTPRQWEIFKAEYLKQQQRG